MARMSRNEKISNAPRQPIYLASPDRIPTAEPMMPHILYPSQPMPATPIAVAPVAAPQVDMSAAHAEAMPRPEGAPSDAAHDPDETRRRKSRPNCASVDAKGVRRRDKSTSPSPRVAALLDAAEQPVDKSSPRSERTQEETSKSTARRHARVDADARKEDASDKPARRRPSSANSHANTDKRDERVTASAHVVSPPARDAPHLQTLPGSLDHYRESCLKLEKARHARVYEAEKRKLYSERAIQHTFDHEVHLAWDDYESSRRTVLFRLLQDNLEKVRRVEELRYKIVRDDTAGVWQRRHEMALRQRGGNGEDDYGRRVDEDGVPIENDKPRRTRKNDNKNSQQPRVKVQLHLDESDILMDLAEMTGEKRVREAESLPERRSKKRK